MLCQNCGKNEATIHLYANVGGQRRQIDFCQNCYQKLKNQQENPMGGIQGMQQDPFGFGNLDDFFRQMSQMQGGNASYSQTPPPACVGGVCE